MAQLGVSIESDVRVDVRSNCVSQQRFATVAICFHPPSPRPEYIEDVDLFDDSAIFEYIKPLARVSNVSRAMMHVVRSLTAALSYLD